MLNQPTALTLISTVTLATLSLLSGSSWADPGEGRGAVRGTGTATGQMLVGGSGTAEGTGIVIYRDPQGRPRVKRGTGSVSGQGIAIGRGTATGEGTAAGRGSAQGEGNVRSF